MGTNSMWDHFALSILDALCDDIDRGVVMEDRIPTLRRNLKDAIDRATAIKVLQSMNRNEEGPVDDDDWPEGSQTKLALDQIGGPP